MSSSPTSTRRKRRLKVIGILLAVLAVALSCAWMAAPGLLVVRTELVSANERPDQAGAAAQKSGYGAVIVLGGEPWTRPPRAAEVYHQVLPRWVIVSGQGDCQDVRRQLEARHVPASRILTECESLSTHQNAKFTVALLREHHVTNAVIVTSWFHSRRALACFRDAAPDITFHSQPTIRPASDPLWPTGYEADRILREYSKILYYWLVYGVPPWT